MGLCRRDRVVGAGEGDVLWRSRCEFARDAEAERTREDLGKCAVGGLSPGRINGGTSGDAVRSEEAVGDMGLRSIFSSPSSLSASLCRGSSPARILWASPRAKCFSSCNVRPYTSSCSARVVPGAGPDVGGVDTLAKMSRLANSTRACASALLLIPCNEIEAPLPFVRLGAVELVLNLSVGDGGVRAVLTVEAVAQDLASTFDEASEFEDNESPLVREGSVSGGFKRETLVRVRSDTE